MGRLAKARGPAAAVAVYCVLAVLAYWPVSPLSSTQIMNCGCRDAAQEAWFLAWAPFALGHLHSLFFSDWIGYPHGVDLAANTSMPLLGVLTAPITALWGPVADYNFLLRLSFAISATSCFFVLRREVDWQPAAFVGGLLYGFSPYVVGEGLGHVFLAFVPIPPLLFAVTYGIVRGHSAKPWRAGLLLGVLGALQFFISPEILVTTGLLLAVGLVAAAAVRPGAALLRLRSSLEAFGSTAAFLVISLAYPVWEFARGPQHIDGPSHSVAGLAPYHADLLSAIVPSQSEKIAPFGLAAVGNRLTGFNVTETGAYVGIPLLMLLGALAWRCRDDLRVRLAAFLGVVSFVLSMGPRLEVDGADTHVPLPFALLQHVPIVQGASAGRFSLYTALFIAVVLVVGIDDWRKTVAARIDPRRAKAVVAGVTVSCLLPLLPAFPYSEVGAGVPAYFTSPAMRAIPPGTVVLAYPYPYTPDDQAMLWSAVSGMRFRIIGDQAAIPGKHGRTTSAPEILRPAVVEGVFLDGMYGTPRILKSTPPPDADTFAKIRLFVTKYDVETIVVDPVGYDPSLVIRYLTSAIGRSPTRVDGLDVWYGLAPT